MFKSLSCMNILTQQIMEINGFRGWKWIDFKRGVQWTLFLPIAAQVRPTFLSEVFYNIISKVWFFYNFNEVQTWH